MSENTNLKWLDLSDNKLKRLPPEVQELTSLEKIWLHGNPIHRDCDMTWMIDWINKFTTGIYRKHVVRDYAQLKCHSGKMRGKPIYQLNQVDMGCYPHDWTIQQKLIVGLSISIGTIIIVAMVIIGLYSRRGRFFMYYYLKMDTIPRDDKNEDLEDIECDAFFCYRSVNFNHPQNANLPTLCITEFLEYVSSIFVQTFYIENCCLSHKDTRWVSDVFMRHKKRRKPAVRPGEGAWVPPGHPREGLDRRQNHSC